MRADTVRGTLSRVELAAALGAVDRRAGGGAALAEKGEERPSRTLPDVTLWRQLDPYPLVGVVGPWNFPLLLSFVDAIPALVAGCAAIIKPSEIAPRFANAVRGRGRKDRRENPGIERGVAVRPRRRPDGVRPRPPGGLRRVHGERLRASVAATGQACRSIERIYAH